MSTVALELLDVNSTDNMTSYYDYNSDFELNDIYLKLDWKKEISMSVRVNSVERLQPKFYLD